MSGGTSCVLREENVARTASVIASTDLPALEQMIRDILAQT